MYPKYEINDVVYMITSESKIRPVLISGVNLTRSAETYTVELQHDDGESISTHTVDVSRLWARPAEITFWMMAEWEEWDRNQKEWEGQ